MTPETRTELERVARGTYERLIPDTPGINKPNVTMSGIKRKAFMEALVTLLAAQRATVLEEAETEIVRLWEEGRISQSARDAVMTRLSKQAQEQRP